MWPFTGGAWVPFPDMPGEHVKVDETWAGGRTRGKGRGVHDKVLVASAVEVRQRKPGTKLDKRKGGRYAGRVRLAIVPDRSAESLCGFVECAVVPGTSLVTDDWSGYASLAKRGYKHLAIAERGDPQVAEEYLPIIHLVFANLKTWLNGIHHGVSHQHLQAYLNEFTFRFNRRFYPFNAFRSLLGSPKSRVKFPLSANSTRETDLPASSAARRARLKSSLLKENTRRGIAGPSVPTDNRTSPSTVALGGSQGNTLPAIVYHFKRKCTDFGSDHLDRTPGEFDPPERREKNHDAFASVQAAVQRDEAHAARKQAGRDANPRAWPNARWCRRWRELYQPAPLARPEPVYHAVRDLRWTTVTAADQANDAGTKDNRRPLRLHGNEKIAGK